MTAADIDKLAREIDELSSEFYNLMLLTGRISEVGGIKDTNDVFQRDVYAPARKVTESEGIAAIVVLMQKRKQMYAGEIKKIKDSAKYKMLCLVNGVVEPEIDTTIK